MCWRDGEEFSGVADEVHILAERTEASARDIAKLIGETQAEAERAVRSIQKSSKEVEVGITLVQSSGAFLKRFQNLHNLLQIKLKRLRIIQVKF